MYLCSLVEARLRPFGLPFLRFGHGELEHQARHRGMGLLEVRPWRRESESVISL